MLYDIVCLYIYIHNILIYTSISFFRQPDVYGGQFSTPVALRPPGDNISGTASTTPSWAQRNYPAECGNSLLFSLLLLITIFLLLIIIIMLIYIYIDTHINIHVNTDIDINIDTNIDIHMNIDINVNVDI